MTHAMAKESDERAREDESRGERERGRDGSEPRRPAPSVDADSAFYWEGLGAGELRLQCCRDCGRHRFPPLPTCSHCGHPEWETVVSPGRGRLYSWIVVHRAFSPAFADDVPYAIGTVELDEGCRMLARLELGDAKPQIDMALEPVFVTHDEWSEARFAPASTPAGADADGSSRGGAR